MADGAQMHAMLKDPDYQIVSIGQGVKWGKML